MAKTLNVENSTPPGRLGAGLRDKAWGELAEAGAELTDKDEALARVEAALAVYQAGPPIRPKRKLQRETAARILQAINGLRLLVDGADNATRKRVYLGIGRKHADDKRNRLDIGRALWARHLDDLQTGADYAIERAARKTGQGLKAQDAARRPLVIELLDIWRSFTGKPLHIARKGERGKQAGLRRFVGEVLKTGAGIELKEKSLLSLMRDAKGELEGRSEDSEESEANND
jgi:hypothetical protein